MSIESLNISALIALSLCGICLFFGCRQTWKVINLWNKPRVIGTVVDTAWEWDSENGLIITPTIRFTPEGQKPLHLKYDVGLGILNSYSKGDEVTVIYDPTKPRYFILDDFSSNFSGPIIIIVALVISYNWLG